MLKQLLLLLSVFLFQGLTIAQPFDFEQLNGPNGFFFDQYIGEINDLAYLSFEENYADSKVYSFDGENFVEINAPNGLRYSFFAGSNNDNYYLVFVNDYFENTVVLLDENGMSTLFEVDPYGFFGGYEFTLNDIPYFTVFDGSFNEIFGFYDGNDLVPVPLPAGFTFSNFIGTLNDVVYISLEDGAGSDLLFAFDGTDFIAIAMPFQSPFFSSPVTMDGEMFLDINNSNFDGFLYSFDGVVLTPVDLPIGFTSFGGFVGSIKDRLFFAFNDDYFSSTVFELEAGNTWKAFPNPVNLNYSFSPGPNRLEKYLFPAYTDDYFFNHLVVLDGNDTKAVDNPAGREYSTYYRDYKQGHFFNFRDDYFTSHLYFYDQTDLISVPAPASLLLSNYSFEYQSKIYFSFRDNNFNQTLFSLNLNFAPSSSDNTVSTERETPYTFSATDFDFSDEDMNDTFQAIELTSLPTKGILHVFGAQVSQGDLIPFDDLEKLNYLPLENGIGTPFDNFTFRVSDGFALSEESYTMFININPTVGVEETNLAAKLDIFPNPASDFVNINIDDFSSVQTLQVSLTSANGQVLKTKRMQGPQDRIDLQALPSGIYHLHFQNEEVKLTRGLIINK